MFSGISMASFYGALCGLVVGCALIGKLLAWLLRLVVRMSLALSYAIGVALATVIYLAFSPDYYERFPSTTSAILTGVGCGLVAYGILCVTSRRARVREALQRQVPAPADGVDG